MRNAKIRILSIDGGGIRGIIPACLLIHIENIIKEISRNEDALISDYFDLIAGTSTGAILTALILDSKNNYCAKDMLNLYKEYGNAIFTRSLATRTIDRGALFNPLYQHEVLETVLKKYFDDLLISQLKRPCLIPTYNLETGNAEFISGLEIFQNIGQDKLVRDVIRATTAAPTYFEPAKKGRYSFIDGGMFANNPALCAYVEATKFPLEPKTSDIMILSFGTGSVNRKYPYTEARKWGRLNWLRPALEIYSSASSQTVNHQLEKLYENKELKENYLRIEPHLEDFNVNTAMDDTSVKNIENLIKVGMKLCEIHDLELRKFLKQVVMSNVLSHHELLYTYSKTKK